MADYTSFSSEQLAADASFQLWVQQPTQQVSQFWEEWLRSHPEKSDLVTEAKAIVTLLHMPKRQVPTWEIDQAIEAVKAKILAEETGRQQGRRLLWGNAWWQVAAVFAGILLTSLFMYLYLLRQTDAEVYATQYGEIKEVALPDGSMVTLSGNSQLRVSKAWMSSLEQDTQADSVLVREVWLDGMAYFKVKHLTKSAKNSEPIKFIVHAADVHVEVIGTEFNVFNRAERVKVVLNSGKIQLRIEEKEQVSMKPGELVEMNKLNNSYQIKEVNSQLYTSWKNGELKFDHTSLSQVAALIEDAYGYNVIFKSEALAKRKLSGTIQNRDLTFLLRTISIILSIEARQQGNQIIISEPSMRK